MSGYQVGYIVGSLSTESINRTLAEALIRVAPKHLKFVEIPILDLQLYNRDFDTDYPQRVRRSRMRSPRRMRCYSCRPSTTGVSRAA
jgi:NAD(P)H-dependent FMN reductase